MLFGFVGQFDKSSNHDMVAVHSVGHLSCFCHGTMFLVEVHILA